MDIDEAFDRALNIWLSFSEPDEDGVLRAYFGPTTDLDAEDVEALDEKLGTNGLWLEHRRGGEPGLYVCGHPLI